MVVDKETFGCSNVVIGRPALVACERSKTRVHGAFRRAWFAARETATGMWASHTFEVVDAADEGLPPRAILPARHLAAMN